MTSFPLEEFRFDPMPMDPSHPFALTISLELFPRVLSFFSFGFFYNLKPEVVIKLAIGRYLDFII